MVAATPGHKFRVLFAHGITVHRRCNGVRGINPSAYEFGKHRAASFIKQRALDNVENFDRDQWAVMKIHLGGILLCHGEAHLNGLTGIATASPILRQMSDRRLVEIEGPVLRISEAGRPSARIVAHCFD